MKKALIVINDETNCQIFELDQRTEQRRILNKTTLKKCRKELEYFIPSARFSEKYELGLWDGRFRFMDEYGKTYINVVDRILDILSNDGYEIDIEDNRKCDIDVEFETIDENYMSDIYWPNDHRLAGKPIVMMEHQVRCVNALIQHPQSLIEAATSSGKTLVIAALARKLKDSGRIIIVVPNVSLLEQTRNFLKYMQIDVGTLYGSNKDFDNDVIVATWQSIFSAFKRTRVMEKLSQDEVQRLLSGVVGFVVDEAHGAGADSLFTLMTKTFSNIPIRWGMTGTLPKDSLSRTKILVGMGPTVEKVEPKELQDKGLIASCKIHMKEMIDKATFKDYHSEKKYIIEDDEKRKFYVDEIKKISETGNTLVLVDRVKFGKQLVSDLEDVGVDVKFVAGATKSEERMDTYQNIHESNNQVIVATVGVAAVGIDIPRLFNIVFLEIGKSYIKIIQAVGRGLRLAADKDHADIYDYYNSTKYSKKHSNQRFNYYKEKEFEVDRKKIYNWRTE